MRSEFKVILAGLVLALAIPAEAFARGRGGFSAGGRGVAFAGNRGAAAARGHTFTGPNGGTIQHGGAAGVTRGPLGGIHAGGVEGTKITTPGGRTIGNVSGGRVNAGPLGGVTARGGHVIGGSGPGGSAIVGHRGGVAVGPFGGVAAGGSRVVAGHSTRYMSGAAIRTQAVAVRGGYYHGAFTAGWYGRYPAAWRPGRWATPNYWVAPVWTSVAALCAITSPPIYYDYGSNVILQDNYVYVDGNQTITAPDYAEQAVGYADAGRKAEPASNEEWQALGVFGMIQPEEKVAQRIFQLAVSKGGVIRGNYYDAVADTTTPVYGSVSSKSQRACWSIGDKKTIVFETGINNLTQDQTPILVHYGTDRTDQMILVRLEEPKGNAK
jgi:hypothetical protein